MVSGTPLKVSLARRQPQIEPINDATSSAAWATLGKYLFFVYISSLLFNERYSIESVTRHFLK